MATYRDVVEQALEDLGYQGAETPVEPADAKKAFVILNDMLAEWDATGILPGSQPGEALGDTLRIPRYSKSAVISNLAGRCSAPFRKPITAELAAVIKSTSESLLRITAKIGPVKLPGTLPMGSGNESYDDDRFFDENNEANF